MTKQPCFCQPGVMSQCVAADYKEEMSCEFFTKSDCGNRCMNKNTQLNNHCWDSKAQATGLQLPELITEEQEPALDLSDLFTGNERRSCLSCTRYVCAFLQREHDDAIKLRGTGLTSDELWDIGTACLSYEDNLQGGT